jgi:hypothetical protein
VGGAISALLALDQIARLLSCSRDFSPLDVGSRGQLADDASVRASLRRVPRDAIAFAEAAQRMRGVPEKALVKQLM